MAVCVSLLLSGPTAEEMPVTLPPPCPTATPSDKRLEFVNVTEQWPQFVGMWSHGRIMLSSRWCNSGHRYVITQSDVRNCTSDCTSDNGPVL